MSQNKPIIVLATGIFFPDVGGPATHVRRIAEAFQAKGIDPRVVAYGSPQENTFPFAVYRISRQASAWLRGWRYFWRVFWLARTSRVVYAFDLTSAGLPAFVAAKFWGKPFFLRIGGDPIWERVVEKNQRFISLSDYYKQHLYLADKPGLYRWLCFFLRHTDQIITYTGILQDLYTQHFGVAKEKIHIIKNPLSVRAPATTILSPHPVVLFAGRFVSYKNLPLVIDAFVEVRKKLGRGKLSLVGHGPEQTALEKKIQALGASDYITISPSLPQEQLFQAIQAADVTLGPAITEFNPNFILESLSFGKPVILSRGHGLSVSLPEMFLFDPVNQAELQEKLLFLLQQENYEVAVETVAKLPREIPWEQVTDEHYRLVKDLL